MLPPHFLKQRQGLPLEAKVLMSQRKIREFYDYFQGQIYVSFSGGKDSTVLLDLVRSIYPDVSAVFVDTGLEYPEIRDFVKSFDNITWLRPKMPFNQVVEKYGYPVVSKQNSLKINELQVRPKGGGTYHLRKTGYTSKGRFNPNAKLPQKWMFLEHAPFKVSGKCCDIMKKNPAKDFEKETGLYPIIGTMASDSRMRRGDYLRWGCNMYENNRKQSRPIAFWLEQDVWDYIKLKSLPYCSLYDNGWERTGCMFCMFGVHMEEGLNRFQRMEVSHPKQYDYCINKLGCGKVLDYIGVKYTNKNEGLF